MKKFILLMSLALLTTSASVNVTALSYKDVFICASKGGKNIILVKPAVALTHARLQ